MEVILDYKRLMDEKEAHEYLMEKFKFPDYYGKNLDALYDCLSELEETDVTFENVDRDMDETTYAYDIYCLFHEVLEDYDNLNLIVKYNE